MDFSALLDFARQESAVISGAPFLSALLLLAGALAGWVIAWQLSDAQVKTKDATIEHLKEQLASVKAPPAPIKNEVASPTPTALLDHSRETFTDRVFANETVIVDGCSFNRCLFRDAILEFRGEGGFLFIDCKLQGTTHIRPRHPAINAFLSLAETLKMAVDVIDLNRKNQATGEWVQLSRTQRATLPQPQNSKTDGEPTP